MLLESGGQSLVDSKDLLQGGLQVMGVSDRPDGRGGGGLVGQEMGKIQVFFLSGAHWP